jgi:hypothetical protein
MRLPIRTALLLLLLCLPAAQARADLILKGSIPADLHLTADATYTATVDSLLCWIHLPFHDSPRYTSADAQASPDAQGHYEIRMPLHRNVSGDPFDLCKTRMDLLSFDVRDSSRRILVELDLESPSRIALGEIRQVVCTRKAPYKCWLNGEVPVADQVIGFDIPGADPARDIEQTIDFAWEGGR